MRSAQYMSYLRSPEWAERRRAAIARAGGRCQRCPITFGLEVHHLNYDRLGNELPDDLLVVCSDCHQGEDLRRAARTRFKAFGRRLDAWATKVYGEDWAQRHDEDVVAERFETWLERRGEL